MSFDSLHLPEFLSNTLARLRFVEPTPIQREAIPHVLAGSDLVGIAQTGTGKTAAFALPTIAALNAIPGPRRVEVLAVTPTRELALQVAASFRKFSEDSPRKLEVLALIGGADIDKQIRSLGHGVDVVVATPGRLIDLVGRSELNLEFLKILVLDEADKLLDLGFAEELDSFLNFLPKTRQNLLFSATFPERVLALSQRFLKDPVHVTVEVEFPIVETIAQRVFQVDSDARRGLLQHLIEHENWAQVLVFVATKVKARNLAGKLRIAGFSADELHGNLEQDERIDALRSFKSGKYQVLVATDVAARGIDIEKLDCVVNFDLPRSPDDYIHRIGRTGRAGRVGVAISFVDHESEAQFRLIEKRSGVSLEREQIAGFELTGEAPKKSKGPAPVKGKRKSKKDKLRELIP